MVGTVALVCRIVIIDALATVHDAGVQMIGTSIVRVISMD